MPKHGFDLLNMLGAQQLGFQRSPQRRDHWIIRDFLKNPDNSKVSRILDCLLANSQTDLKISVIFMFIFNILQPIFEAVLTGVLIDTTPRRELLSGES